MEQRKVPGRMGRLAEGDAFFDRDEVISRAWNLLETSNLLLLAPRRVGKSSLLNRMKEQSVEKGYDALYLSVPDAEDELDFIRRLVRGFRELDSGPGHWIGAFKDQMPKDLEIVVKTSLLELRGKGFDWRRPAEELEGMLRRADGRALVLIDELPLLVGNVVRAEPAGARAERFLLWLKRLREQYSPRWFFAGSIGLDSLARRLKLSGTIHDLQPIELGEFSEAKARAYLAGRAAYHGWELTPDTVDAILGAVEWPIPFHLNLVFEELRAVVGERNEAPSAALLEMAVARLMASGRTHFDHWDERLSKMLDGRYPHFCELILGMACQGSTGVLIETLDLRFRQEVGDDQERGEILRDLVDLLVSDGYLVRRSGVLHFRSALVRRYWREVQQ